MIKNLSTQSLRFFSCLLLLGIGSLAQAGDKEDLTAMLHEFLATSYKEATHETFWADDVVYTSSDGTRRYKADILKGFEGSDPNVEPDVIYSGTEVDIRVYGDSAVVAFKLVGTPENGSRVEYYYNTGTFLKRDGIWQAVAWQATIIPPS